jgi:RNA polymerase sigma-70 factor (ECF subfamily)
MSHEATWEEHRPALLGVAYRITGQLADAEDVVQEAWLRWREVDMAAVRDTRAFLVRITTRLAIDRLRRIRARRETYAGEWLPEPVRTGDDPAAAIANAEALSMALLVVLESLSPLERAVYVLREAFGLSHAEIAEALGRSEPAVRQLARRARDHVRERRPRFDAEDDQRRDVTSRFLAASRAGDLPGLMEVLAPGVELVADSGGRVRAPLLPVRGADRVARFLIAVAGRPLPDQRVEIVELNGGPGIVVRSGDAAAAAVLLDVDGGRVTRIWLVGNPDKLGRLAG